MNHHTYYTYVKANGANFFTIVLLPEKSGRFPTVVCRSPYVKQTVGMEEDAIVQAYYESMKAWPERGYAVAFQHCRGQGKSTGAFVPYVHEREDGLAFREWIRRQSFYNGELFLMGGSYTASLHYATAPFECDVRAAVFEVQDSERYRLWYRNGQMRKGHANWHFALYKDKCGLPKHFSMRSFSQLPLSGLSERVLSDHAADFEEMLAARSPFHDFWRTRFGGIDAKDAVANAGIPILLTTGYNDFYVGGVFRMWERMEEATRQKCALLVSPYDHGDGHHRELGLSFPNGRRREAFGSDYPIAWFDHVRLGSPLPFSKGVITYYRAFANEWETDFFARHTEIVTVPLGMGERSFSYDPANPPAFRAEGLLAEDLSEREDVITLFTPTFDADTFVKGRMGMRLTVSSTAHDTAFYARISLQKSDCAYVLRHDITSIDYQLGDYTPGRPVTLDLSFDEYAFLIQKGERLRIDISSADDNTYVCHTNHRGEYAMQTETVKAMNTVILDGSHLILPVETK